MEKQETLAENNKIAVKMLGEFSIQCGDRVVTDNVGRVKKVWMLIEYLLDNRDKSVSQEKIIDILWSEEECENPTNALKNLVYRARTMLRELGTDEEYICYVRNSYEWNNDIPCEIDIEQFEFWWKKALSDPQEKKLDDYLHAVELYRGEFLPKSSYADWVISKNAYYATIYNECILNAVKLLREAGNYELIVHICEEAIAYYPFEEQVHRYLLEAYAQTGKHNKAMAHYEHLSKLFYKEFGVNLSEETKRLYQQISKEMHNLEMDLDVIQEQLKETYDHGKGAFYCDYEIFKNIYRIQARSVARTGHSIYVALITITDRIGRPLQQQRAQKEMEALLDCTVNSLRKSDVVSMYNASQLVIMLPMINYENGEMVLGRILDKFRRQPGHVGVELRTMLRLIEITV